MRYFVLIGLFILYTSTHIKSQSIDCSRIINEFGIGTIKVGHKLSKRQLERYNNYKKIISSIPRKGVWRAKRYEVENGLIRIYLRKKNRWSLTKNIVEYIFIHAPLKAITNRGIKLGVSTKQEVIEKYGLSIRPGMLEYDFGGSHMHIWFDENQRVTTIYIHEWTLPKNKYSVTIPDKPK